MVAHAQKPYFVFPRNGRVHLNQWGRQFSRLLAAEVCASAWVMLDRPRSEVAWENWLPTPFASFPFTSPPVRHRVPPGSERALRLMTTAISHNILNLFNYPNLIPCHKQKSFGWRFNDAGYNKTYVNLQVICVFQQVLIANPNIRFHIHQ